MLVRPNLAWSVGILPTSTDLSFDASSTCTLVVLSPSPQIARQSAQITHANIMGYNGAILEASAVHSALHADPATFEPEKFLDGLLTVMKKAEESLAEDGGDIYSSKLRSMKEMLKADTTTDDVVKKLGACQ